MSYHPVSGDSNPSGSDPLLSPTLDTNVLSSQNIKLHDDESDSGSEVSSIFERINDQTEAQTSVKTNSSLSSTEPEHTTERAGTDANEHAFDYDDIDHDDRQLLFSEPEKQTVSYTLLKRRYRIRYIIYSVLLTIVLFCAFLLITYHFNKNSFASVSASHANQTSVLSNSTTAAPNATLETTSKPASTEEGPGFGKPKIDSSKRLVLMDDWNKGTFNPSFQRFEIVSAAPGEDYLSHLLHESNEGYVLHEWLDRSNRSLLFETEQRIFTFNKSMYLASDFILGPDRKHALLVANKKRNRRHSFFAHYFLYNLESKKISPLHIEKPTEKIVLAVWSPVGDKVAFVQDNNLYVHILKQDSEGEVKQITKDGSADIFYGRPDWVYEEEVLASNTAMWWSPNGDYLAFFRTNDTVVQEFPIPFFVQNIPSGQYPYPELANLKYPKPGSPNPVVDLLLLETKSFESYQVPIDDDKDGADKLITEVLWTGDNDVMLRMTDRESKVLKVAVVDAKQRSGKIIRVMDASKDGGWFEVSHNTHFVPADAKNGRDQNGYIEIQVVDGYNHLAYYSPANATEPKSILTRGNWEVVDSEIGFHAKANRVYFSSTKKSSVERHIYSVNLDGSDLKALTNESTDGWYQARFSPDGRFAIIDYEGPDVPWHAALDLEEKDVWGSAKKYGSNAGLESLLKEYHLPERIYSQVIVAVGANSTDIMANTVEYRPPNFNESLKYPVLFYPYGGPGSQVVKKQFSVSFPQVVASTLNAIVVTVDGRGTGYRGRAFRNIVREHIGRYEAQDQITAARNWTSRTYVDNERMAIWGWSYGGFTTLKTLETDGGETFKYGMAVAPVTDWRFYDSVYAERYMRLPDADHNKQGYEESTISNVRRLAQNKRFLVMHGTGDDNVHFQNTLALLDKFDVDGIENYDLHVFPDSDHSIYFHGAHKIVYDKLLHWISDAFTYKFLRLMKKRSQIP